jgi:uncharacterized repeat protein (TIGR03803 family)
MVPFLMPKKTSCFERPALVLSLCTAQRMFLIFRRHVPILVFLVVVGMVSPFTPVLVESADAQTFTVVREFTGGADGAYPGELAIDQSGTTLYGSDSGVEANYGVVFRLKHSGDGWTFTPLYSFQGGSDGVTPNPVVIGPDGNLYGTTQFGGSCPPGNCGTVFKLSPSPAVCKAALCPWVKTLLYDFAGGNDGTLPVGPLVFGQDGSIYGVASRGGPNNYGIVYKLAKSNGAWTESILHTFSYDDGIYPSDGVTLDQFGNLYGVAYGGGANNYGTVYELSPSGSGWQFALLHTFQTQNDGAFPRGSLIFDAAGNLYGDTIGAAPSETGGTVFMLTPTNGGWTESLLYILTGIVGPLSRLTMDATGTLYGTTDSDGVFRFGNVFKLAPSNGSWTYTSLHDFNYNDAAYPASNIVFDSQGNLYGTAARGGYFDYGIVFEITP